MAATAPAQRPETTSKKDRLRRIIREKSYLSGEFTLASGRTASYFLDMKPTMLDPVGANLIGDLVLEALQGEQVDAVGGLVTGCIPIVTLVCAKSLGTDRPISGFFVRKEPKGHGTNKRIDGNLGRGMRVVLVEDVTTTGGSVLKAVDEALAVGCEVTKVVTIVDRLEGARENLERRGIGFVALFTRDEFE